MVTGVEQAKTIITSGLCSTVQLELELRTRTPETRLCTSASLWSIQGCVQVARESSTVGASFTLMVAVVVALGGEKQGRERSNEETEKRVV